MADQRAEATMHYLQSIEKRFSKSRLMMLQRQRRKHRENDKRTKKKQILREREEESKRREEIFFTQPELERKCKDRAGPKRKKNFLGGETS
ncbi:hypothetical protein AVEN_267728-1 [Araneus ventricosus]|uniref:Uncharacterized protein n=1 Tax=Araneus ventricosus TaxID=182803 RepID=A0A4Y2CYW1_ARAVE|nr:hypothetical protein AVEN_267728-1 [Araneus ventricosus]